MEWKTVTNATQYDIKYVKTSILSPGKETKEELIRRVSTNYKRLTDLRDRHLYPIQVRAVNSKGLSDWSDTIYTFPTRKAVPIITSDRVSFIPINGYRQPVENNHETIGRYTYYLCVNSITISEPDKILIQIIEGMRKWLNKTDNMVTYIQKRWDCNDTDKGKLSEPNSKNFILFNDMESVEMVCGTGNPACVARLHSTIDRKRIIKSQMHLDEKYFTLPVYYRVRNVHGKSCSKLSQIITHEAGHVYGLDDVPGRRDSIMSSNMFQTCIPTEHDLVALKAIYQSRQ